MPSEKISVVEDAKRETKDVTITPAVQGLPITSAGRKRLLDDNSKGKLIIEFENPKFSYPQYIDASGYRDSKGKVIQYINPHNGEAEQIAILPPKMEFDLSTDVGKLKADFVLGFGIQKRLGVKVKITNTAERSDKTINLKEKEYEVAARVRELVEDPSKLEMLALNLGGIDFIGAKARDVKAAIYNKVAADPLSVEKVLNDVDFDFKATILQATKLKVLDEKMGAYYYGTIYLGANLRQAISFCREQKDIYASIIKDLK